jgi:hypothetical protein
MEQFTPDVGGDVTYDHLSFHRDYGKGDREVMGRYETAVSGQAEASNIQLGNLQCIGLNKFSPGFYLVSHQSGSMVVVQS